VADGVLLKWGNSCEGVRAIITGEPIGRRCEICGEPIMKKFQEEVFVSTGRSLGKIVIWADRLTCSGNCRAIRHQRLDLMGMKEINGEYPVNLRTSNR